MYEEAAEKLYQEFMGTDGLPEEHFNAIIEYQRHRPSREERHEEDERPSKQSRYKLRSQLRKGDPAYPGRSFAYRPVKKDQTKRNWVIYKLFLVFLGGFRGVF